MAKGKSAKASKGKAGKGSKGSKGKKGMKGKKVKSSASLSSSSSSALSTSSATALAMRVGAGSSDEAPAGALFHIKDLKLPHLRELIDTLITDEDHDGWIEEHELLAAMDRYERTKRGYKHLLWAVVGLVVVIGFLLAANFGLAVAAVHLSKDSSVSGANTRGATSVLVSGSDAGGYDAASLVRTGSIETPIAVGGEAPPEPSRRRSVLTRSTADVVDVCENHVGVSTAGLNVSFTVLRLHTPSAGDMVLIRSWAGIGSVPYMGAAGQGTESTVLGRFVVTNAETSTVMPSLIILDGHAGIPESPVRICCPSGGGECAYARAVHAASEATPASRLHRSRAHRSHAACMAAAADHEYCPEHAVARDADGLIFTPRSSELQIRIGSFSTTVDSERELIAQQELIIDAMEDHNVQQITVVLDDETLHVGRQTCSQSRCGTSGSSCRSNHVCKECFPAAAMVALADGSSVAIADLVVGSAVLSVSPTTGKTESATFLGFGKRDADAVYTAVRLTLADGASVAASPIHLVHVVRGGAPLTVPFSAVRVGDAVWRSTGAPATVAAVTTETVVGAYSPMTSTGTLVVDGVAASMWTELLVADDSLLASAVSAVSSALGTDLHSILNTVALPIVRALHALLPASVWESYFFSADPSSSSPSAVVFLGQRLAHGVAHSA